MFGVEERGTIKAVVIRAFRSQVPRNSIVSRSANVVTDDEGGIRAWGDNDGAELIAVVRGCPGLSSVSRVVGAISRIRSKVSILTVEEFKESRLW